MLKKCCSLPNLLCLLRINTYFNPALIENYDKTVCHGLYKVCNVNSNDISSAQLALPVRMVGLAVSSLSILALPAFLAPAFGANDILTKIFSEASEDVPFTNAFEKWLSLTKKPKNLIEGTQTKWTKPVYVKTTQDLISRVDDKCLNVFTAHQGKIGSQ